MDFNLKLPNILKKYREEIEATLQPCVYITAMSAKSLPWQSKIGGGSYYLPLADFVENDFPRNTHTNQLLDFIGQINFEEVPHLPFFPQKGVLQFFVDWNSPNFGLDDPTRLEKKVGFRVIFYPEVIKNEEMLYTEFPNGERSFYGGQLQFEWCMESISFDDFRRELVYSKELSDLMLKYYYCDYDYNRTKIGGYHYSSNGFDPRCTIGMSQDLTDNILLMQFSGGEVISWGDSGTACFFIDKKDLLELNFTNVLYHWDST